MTLEDYELVVTNTNGSVTSFRIYFKELKTLFEKSLGFMFSKNNNKVLLFDMKHLVRYSITNIFVFFSLDLIFLDENNNVVDFKKQFLPFSFRYIPIKKYRYLIEIPSIIGLTKKIQLGDNIRFIKIK